MKHLKKRPVAVLIALLVVIVSLLFGVNRSLGQQAAAMTEQFYIGVLDQEAGFRRTSIHSLLDRRATGAVRILSIGTHNFEHEDSLRGPEAELREARETLRDLLEAGAPPRALFRADQALTMALDRYYALLHPLMLEAQREDLETLEAEYAAVLSATRAITESGYNEAVGAFNRMVWGRFPINVLRPIVFVQPPEMFAY